MNALSLKQRAQILHMLVEGNSLKATARMADVSRNTADKQLRGFCLSGLNFGRIHQSLRVTPAMEAGQR